MEQLLACNSSWLDDQPTMVVATGGYVPTTPSVITTTELPTSNLVYWPYYQPVFYASEARPIKLALSEVERLRKAAKADPALKAILRKFTGQIEITVDFE